ncbi:MAG: replication initiator protein [Microviridae sp.]|nr:MAG: replication initiator protein [Microviridae sp.]
MPCEGPITIKTPSGHNIQVKCKQCRSCRIAKHSALRFRSLLEFQHSLSAEFISMTYKPENLPLNGSHTPFQSFLKRLRQHNKRHHNPNKIRYLCCGEYGDLSGEFHHHALLFNSLPTWNKLFTTQNSDQLLTKLWQLGRCDSGEVNTTTIDYVTNYCTKSTLDSPDKKHFAHWSNHFGSYGMENLCQRYKNKGTHFTSMPTLISVNGKTYSLDAAMQKIIKKQFNLPDTENIDLEMRNYAQSCIDSGFMPHSYQDHETGLTRIYDEKTMPNLDLTQKTTNAILKTRKLLDSPDFRKLKRKI